MILQACNRCVLRQLRTAYTTSIHVQDARHTPGLRVYLHGQFHCWLQDLPEECTCRNRLRRAA